MKLTHSLSLIAIVAATIFFVDGCTDVPNSPPDPYNSCPEPYDDIYGFRIPNGSHNQMRVSRSGKLLSYSGGLGSLPRILNLESGALQKLDISASLPRILASSQVG